MIMQDTRKLKQTNILHYFLISSLVSYLSRFPNIYWIFIGKKNYLGETYLTEAPVCHVVLLLGRVCALVIQEMTFLTNQSQTSYEEQMVQVIHP